MLIEALSAPLRKALTFNSLDFEFETEYTAETEPADDAANGVYTVSPGDVTTASSLIVYPYCMGPISSTWWMRVSGWKAIGNDPSTQIWVRIILSQAAWVAGVHAGFENRTLNQEERFADQGGAPAYMILATLGCKKVQFEFALQPLSNVVGMNALWALV